MVFYYYKEISEVKKMKNYNTVIIGATFSAMGILDTHKSDTLVIENKAKPGYEYIDSFYCDNNKGFDETDKGSFFTFLKDCDVSDKPYYFDLTPYVAKWLCDSGAKVLFFTQVMKMDKSEDGYVLTIFNSYGKSEIFAKNVIDTRTKEYDSKSLGFITDSKIAVSVPELSEKYISEDFCIYHYNLSSKDDYVTARRKIVSLIKNTQVNKNNAQLIAIADEFYLKGEKKKGMLDINYKEIYSSSFDNPFVAYNEGRKMGAEIND